MVDSQPLPPACPPLNGCKRCAENIGATFGILFPNPFLHEAVRRACPSQQSSRASSDPPMTPAGLEPAIPGSVGRCLIHWATGPMVCPTWEFPYNRVASVTKINARRAAAIAGARSLAAANGRRVEGEAGPRQRPPRPKVSSERAREEGRRENQSFPPPSALANAQGHGARGAGRDWLTHYVPDEKPSAR